jgi:predicted TPR repeat methyltransferase
LFTDYLYLLWVTFFVFLAVSSLSLNTKSHVEQAKHSLTMHITYTLLIFCLVLLVISSAEETIEDLYRRVIREWHSQRSWKPWENYADTLLKRFENCKQIKDSKGKRLEIVGGLEEGILAIEKATLGAGEDSQRDSVISTLYFIYGKVLNQLSDEECHALALDPHTLLIGAETVSQESAPSEFLCKENAENALRNSITLDATNTDAELLLQSITGLDGSSVHERKPKEFVAELFDSFADTFDEKLVNGLGYKVPEMIGSVAKELGRFNCVLDAGCGTGLAGRYLRHLIENDGIMIGVDASQKMLDIAKKCTSKKGCGLKPEAVVASDVEEEFPLYDDLLVLDLEDMNLENTLQLNREVPSKGFDLIVAADVLVYFGNITKLLKTFSNISTPGATLIFTCERATEEEAPLGWRLLSSGRFAHTKSHVVNASLEAGYNLIIYKEIVPRMERGKEVRGHLFAFKLDVKDEL